MRTLRVFVLSCALACATLLLRAQDGVGGARFDGIRYAPQFQMDLALGANTDLAKSSSNPASRLFGTRPGTVPAFDVLCQQPVTKCKGYMLVDDGSSTPQEHVYRSRTLGRELNVSLGVNFCLDLRKR